MNDLEKDHINKNLPRLIELTICSEHLLAILSAHDILGSNDVAVLENKILNSHEKSKKLYDILKTRKNGYKIIKDALLQTRQTGAHEILHKITRVKGVAGESLKNQITYDRNIKIGTGASNTKVFRGKFGIRDVAIKQISLDDIDVTQALKEINLLKTVDWHENIVQYYTAEVIDSYILIALELCTFNLDEWVESNRKENFDPVEVLRQATSGITHLHKNNIIHGDLKPANILISVLQRDGFRVKISDFGMSKKVLDDRTSCTLGSSGLVIGTNGWIAPEVAKYLEGNPSEKTVLKMSFAADIFSLGCVYYFVLTNGIHPYGHKFRRLTNILDNKFSLKINELTCKENGVISLIRSMINYNHKERPPSSALLSHLFFWSTNKKLMFLSDVSTLFKKNSGDVRQCISRIDSSYFTNWSKNIAVEVREFLGKLDSTNGTVVELVDSIVSIKNDYESLPQSVKKVLGKLPDKFMEFWTNRFNLLFPLLLQSLQSLKESHNLKSYFADNYNFYFITDDKSRKPTEMVHNLFSFLDDKSQKPTEMLHKEQYVWSKPSSPERDIKNYPKENFKENVYETLSVKNLAETFEFIFTEKLLGLDPKVVFEERVLMETIKSGNLATIEKCCQNYNILSHKPSRSIKRLVGFNDLVIFGIFNMSVIRRGFKNSPIIHNQLQNNLCHVNVKRSLDYNYYQRPYIFGTLLHAAVIGGKFKVVAFLLEKQGFQEMLKLQSQTLQFRYLLFVCVMNTKGAEDFIIKEKISILNTLIKLNANLINIKSAEFYRSPLFAPHVHIDLLIHLIKLGLDIFITDPNRNTFLHLVSKYISSVEYYKLIKFIIDQKLVNILYTFNNEGLSPLVMAILTLHEIPVDTFELLQKKSDFSVRKHDSSKFNQKSLLYSAVERSSSSKLIGKLISMGANIRNIDSFGANLIHLCVGIENLDLLAFALSNHKSIINETDKQGHTALHYVYMKKCKNYIKLTEMLVSKGADVNKKEPKSGNKAIFYAIIGNYYCNFNWDCYLSMLKCLTKNDKNLDSYNSRGYSILHEVVHYHTDKRILQYLIKLGVNVHKRNIYKQTVLHVAVKAKNYKMIEYLISIGVDVNAQDVNGFTAVHLLFGNKNSRNLFQNHNFKVTEMLHLFGEAKNFNWKAKSNQGDTILDLAIQVKYSLDKSVIPYIKSKVQS